MILKSFMVLLGMSLVACNLGYNDEDQLFISSGKGDLAKVKELLAKGVDVNYRYKHIQRDFEPYESSLIAAAENGHLEVVKALVEAGADLEISNTYNGHTALYAAVKYKKPDVIGYLLSVGAEPNVSGNITRNSTMMLAVRQNNFELIKLLRKYGSWPDPTILSTDIIAGETGRDVVSAAIALKRPYVGYLKNLQNHCSKVLKTKTTCATVIVKKFKKSTKSLEF